LFFERDQSIPKRKSDNRKRLLPFLYLVFSFKRWSSILGPEKQNPVYIARAKVAAARKRAATIYCAVTSCTVLFIPNVFWLRHKNDKDRASSQSAKSFFRAQLEILQRRVVKAVHVSLCDAFCNFIR